MGILSIIGNDEF